MPSKSNLTVNFPGKEAVFVTISFFEIILYDFDIVAKLPFYNPTMRVIRIVPGSHSSGY